MIVSLSHVFESVDIIVYYQAYDELTLCYYCFPMYIESDMFIYGFGVLFPLMLLGLALIKRGARAELGRGLYALLLIYALIPAGQFLHYAHTKFLDYLPANLITYWFLYGIFLGSIIIRNLSDSLARRVIRFLPWNLIGLILFLLSIGLNFIPFSSTLLSVINRRGIRISEAIYWLLLSGWVLFTFLALISIIKNYRQYRFPMLRNRILMWGLALVVLSIGNVLGSVQEEILGSIFIVFGLIGITLIVQTPKLPHLGIMIRRISNSLISIALEFVIYGLVFFGMQFLLSEVIHFHSLATAAILSLIVIALVNPLLKIFLGWIDRMFFGEEQDVRGILREFSQKISNILDMELLSAVVVDLVRDLLGVEGGMMFLIELEMGPKGEKQYRFKQGLKKKENTQLGVLPSDSPLVQAWNQQRQALTQAEIEMLPIFKTLKSETLRWLSKLEMDVYVPIHAQEEWVGLLALGPKSSGASYYSEDIELLDTLADQTAVALQNARLVESLMRVNKEFRKAYSSMEDAHTKLQKIDRTKSDFISISSHELRTPLTILSGYSQMLLDAPDIKENPIYADATRGVFDGAQRLHEIVDSMLDVAKIDMHDLALQSEPVSLEYVLRKTSNEISEALKDRKLTFEISPEIKKLPHVEGDATALQKVFRHLLSNAIKYTPDGGMISISCKEIVQGSPKSPQGGVEIVVRDTGIGIDPRYIDLIFTKFYQTGDVDLHSSGKTKFKGGGPGLGLAIVRGIVTALGGRVWAESKGYDEKNNPGSCFHVILPSSDSNEFQFPPI